MRRKKRNTNLKILKRAFMGRWYIMVMWNTKNTVTDWLPNGNQGILISVHILCRWATCTKLGEVTRPAATHFEPKVRDDSQYNVQLMTVTPGLSSSTQFTDYVCVQIPGREMKNAATKTIRMIRANLTFDGSPKWFRDNSWYSSFGYTTECRSIL